MNQAINHQTILNVLCQIHDPELEINIVDLGLIYGVRIEDGHVEVQMTMTSPGCPMHEVITDAAQGSIEAIPGVNSVEIQLVWTPPWTPDFLSAEAKAQLGRR